LRERRAGVELDHEPLVADHRDPVAHREPYQAGAERLDVDVEVGGGEAGGVLARGRDQEGALALLAAATSITSPGVTRNDGRSRAATRRDDAQREVGNRNHLP
jgi:hypothetical protein